MKITVNPIDHDSYVRIPEIVANQLEFKADDRVAGNVAGDTVVMESKIARSTSVLSALIAQCDLSKADPPVADYLAGYA